MAYKTKYTIKNKKKYIGDSSNIICRSLWERRFCRYLDETPNVIRWSSEELSIPYKSPSDGLLHRYYPDFLIEIEKPNKVREIRLIEIKPLKQTIPPKQGKKKKTSYINEGIVYAVNESKWKAASKYCEDRGWKFMILTEKDIFPENKC